MKRLVIATIRLYQKTLSPDHGWWAYLNRKTCRFAPTCSEYMIEAIQIHGIIAGGWMGLKRIGRCHPMHRGGYDPVPPKSAIILPSSHHLK